MNNTPAIDAEELNENINQKISELESRIKDYGSFNVIANSMLNNSISTNKGLEGLATTSPVIQEYLALICLKFPFSTGINEILKANESLQAFRDIDRLADEIVKLHSLLNASKFDMIGPDGEISDLDQIAFSITSDELMVRNETFEEHHWQRLEGLYKPYQDYFLKKIGFSVDHAITLCLVIQEHMQKQIDKIVFGPMREAKSMTDEILAYKHRNKKPIRFYPEEYLRQFKTMPDDLIRYNMKAAMASYSTSMVGYSLSFTVEDIRELEDIEEDVVRSFLKAFSIGFEGISPDFSMPEIMHPLKDKPILRDGETYFCASLHLLDYALDRFFAKTLYADQKKIEKYKLHRHDYLLEEGMGYLVKALETDNFHINLLYPGGELDGIIFCGNNVFMVEAKGHQITDRAKKGYFDRIKNHVEVVVEESHYQALRTYKYLKGNSSAEFRKKDGKKIYIDGSKFDKAYFISLTLESFKAISCSLKVGNTLGLFDAETFPWIVSLYDLRIVCEHMEGPSYMVQYIHRRKDFFSLKKFMVEDELTLLGYYLERNLRFDDIIKKHKTLDILKLDSFDQYFNEYYLGKEEKLKKKISIKKHYTLQPVKTLIKALESSGLENAIDAAVLILECGSQMKTTLIDHTKKIKKKFKKDRANHDFRMIGHDGLDKSTWMLSYWVGPPDPDFISFFELMIKRQFKENPVDHFYAILDHGINAFSFSKILHFSNSSGE